MKNEKYTLLQICNLQENYYQRILNPLELGTNGLQIRWSELDAIRPSHFPISQFSNFPIFKFPNWYKRLDRPIS